MRLDTILHNMAEDKTARLWNDIFAQVQFSEMPPSESKPQPTAARRAGFLKQVEAELMRFGRGFGLDEKLLLPQFGNYVDHTLLFDGSVKALAYTPARLWRQRPIIYDTADTRIRQRELGTDFTHRVPRDQLYQVFRAMLAFFELTVVPIGPEGFEIYLIIGSRSTNQLVKNKDITSEERSTILQGLTDFTTKHTKSPQRGLLLDSATYATSDDAERPSAVAAPTYSRQIWRRSVSDTESLL